MSEDVFAKLRDLQADVRARVEASPDWKILQAVERAMGEVRALLPVAAAPAAEAAATDDASAAAACEADVVTKTESEPATVSAGIEAGACEASAVETTGDIAQDGTTAEAPVPDEVKEIVADLAPAAAEAAAAPDGVTAR